MKRPVITPLTAIMLVSLVILAACNRDNAPQSRAAGGEIVLRYSGWDIVQLPVYEELFRQFEAQNPGIRVVTEHTSWGEYWTKLETSIIGRNAPDIFWLNIPRATAYITNNVLLPLTGLNVNFASFPAPHLGAYTRSGVLYGMPKDFDTMGLFYNKKLFDDAGVPYPNNSWTWRELKETSERLTRLLPADTYGIAAPMVWQGGYYETIFQAGGWVFSDDGLQSGFEDPRTIEGVEFWYSLMRDGGSMPLDVLANTPARDVFSAGRVAMLITGSYQAAPFFQQSEHRNNLDVAMVPAGPAGRASTSNALAHVISANSRYPAEAKKLIEFLSSRQAHEHVAASGAVIPSYLGSQAAWVSAYPGKNAQVFIDMVEFAVPLPNAPNASAATGIENDIFARAWLGEITIREACRLVAARANEILKGQ